MANSTHRVEVFRIKEGDLSKHPNADSLSVLKVFDNYQAVVRTADYKPGDLVCYVPPDNILPNEPQYEFLKGKLHIKSCKLRGVVSQGLILRAPEDTQEGDDVAEVLKVTHYVPEIKMGGDGEFISNPPTNPGVDYDLESWFRYGSHFTDGTMIEITEKMDGANTRATFQDGQFWMGSRHHYRKDNKTGQFWRAFHENPWLKDLCEQNPDCVIYGETFGRVQDLRYGAVSNQIWFRVFDIYTPKGFMGVMDRYKAVAKAAGGVNIENHVPILYTGPYSKEVVLQYLDGPSIFPGAQNEREGIVIKPFTESWHPEFGRFVLKAVSPEHSAKGKG